MYFMGLPPKPCRGVSQQNEFLRPLVVGKGNGSIVDSVVSKCCIYLVQFLAYPAYQRKARLPGTA